MFSRCCARTGALARNVDSGPGAIGVISGTCGATSGLSRSDRLAHWAALRRSLWQSGEPPRAKRHCAFLAGGARESANGRNSHVCCGCASTIVRCGRSLQEADCNDADRFRVLLLHLTPSGCDGGPPRSLIQRTAQSEDRFCRQCTGSLNIVTGHSGTCLRRVRVAVVHALAKLDAALGCCDARATHIAACDGDQRSLIHSTRARRSDCERPLKRFRAYRPSPSCHKIASSTDLARPSCRKRGG